MILLTKAIKAELVKRDLEVIKKGECKDDTVVRLFTPWGNASWEIYSATPLKSDGTPTDNHDTNSAVDWHMFGRCDLGQGSELGYVLLSQLEDLTGPFGLKVERDIMRSI